MKQTETWRKLAKSKRFSCFETFRNKIETKSGNGENYNQAPFLVFRNTETMGLYRQIIEMDWNMKKIDYVKTFELFRNISKQKLKEALEKLKIPGPISGVLKSWNNWIIWGNYWKRLKHEGNWLSPNVSKQNWSKLWKR